MFVFVVLSRRRQTRCAVVTGVHTCALPICRRLSWEPARIETKPPSDFLSSALVAGSHGSRRGLKLGLAFAGERQAQVAGSHGSRRRSEARRVGKECGSKGKSRWARYQ